MPTRQELAYDAVSAWLFFPDTLCERQIGCSNKENGVVDHKVVGAKRRACDYQAILAIGNNPIHVQYRMSSYVNSTKILAADVSYDRPTQTGLIIGIDGKK